MNQPVKEYFEGIDAFRKGVKIEDNPHKGREAGKLAWYVGYIEARTKHRLPRIFKDESDEVVLREHE